MGTDHWRTLHFSDRNPNAVVQEQRLVSRWSNNGEGGGAGGAGGEGAGENVMGNDIGASSTDTF